MESSSHKSKVVSLAGRENVPSESVVSLDMDKETNSFLEEHFSWHV